METRKRIPDEVLEAYECRICDKYLTVGPITIHPDGGNVCGRCNKSASVGFLFEYVPTAQEICIPYAIFSYADHLFPCINRFEGCNELIPFSDINEHEVYCRMKMLCCYHCQNYRGTGSQMLSHYRKSHPFCYFNQNSFCFKLRDSLVFLVRNCDFLFDLCVYLVDKKRINLSLQGIKYIKHEFEMNCILRVSNGNSWRKVEACCKIRKNIDSIFCEIDVIEDVDLSTVFCHCTLKRTLEVA